MQQKTPEVDSAAYKVLWGTWDIQYTIAFSQLVYVYHDTLCVLCSKRSEFVKPNHSPAVHSLFEKIRKIAKIRRHSTVKRVKEKMHVVIGEYR